MFMVGVVPAPSARHYTHYLGVSKSGYIAVDAALLTVYLPKQLHIILIAI